MELIAQWARAAARLLVAVSVIGLASVADTGPARAEDPSTRAERLGNEAHEAYTRAEYDEAIGLYMQAFDAVQTAEVLYNIAFIYETKLGDDELALDYYQRVIAHATATNELRERARKRIAKISAGAAAAPSGEGTSGDPAQPRTDPAPEPRPPTATTKWPPAEPQHASVVPWIVMGAGALLLAGGATLGIIASGTQDDFSNATDPATKSDLQSSGRTEALVGDILMLSGAAAIGTGLIMWVLDDPDTPQRRTEVALTPIGGGALLTVGGSL